MDEQKRFAIYGKDRLFMSGVQHALAPFMNTHEGRVVVLVYTGMTLPEVRMYQPRTERDASLVVFCSAACRRMLKGTQIYARALFLQDELSVTLIQRLFLQWLCSPKNSEVLQIQRTDDRILRAIMSGQTVQDLACQLHCNSKTLYSRASLLANRIGTRTRQELYLKVQLLLSQAENVADIKP